MKQRMRFILSILSDPIALLLDEPFSNLDDSGIEICKELINAKKDKGGLILIASNDEREIKLSSKQINLRDYRK
jgi:ABC-2 type transport system ATP-binding protein/heme exporter protein A